MSHWINNLKIELNYHPWGKSPQIGTVTSGECQKKEHHFADYLMHFEMIYSHFWQNQTTLSLSDVQNKFAPLSFYVCHTNILGFEAFLSSEIWFGLSYSITIAAFCMPNILIYQDQEVHSCKRRRCEWTGVQRSGGEALLASPPGRLHKLFNKEIKLQPSGRRRVSPLCENLAFFYLEDHL